MSAARPEDQPTHDALRGPLESWLNQKNQSLLEEVIATWQLAIERFHPDDPGGPVVGPMRRNLRSYP